MWYDLFRPDLFADTLLDIEPVGLRQKGIQALVIDLDNTMIPRDTEHTTEELHAWIDLAKEAGLSICVLSNNRHVRVSKIAAKLDVPMLAMAGKPSKRAFKRAMALINSASNKTAVIGDQMFTDVLGGRRAGLRTILVKPLSTVDLPHTKVLRYLERYLVKRMQKSGLILCASRGGDL